MQNIRYVTPVKGLFDPGRGCNPQAENRCFTGCRELLILKTLNWRAPEKYFTGDHNCFVPALTTFCDMGCKTKSCWSRQSGTCELPVTSWVSVTRRINYAHGHVLQDDSEPTTLGTDKPLCSKALVSIQLYSIYLNSDKEILNSDKEIKRNIKFWKEIKKKY